MTHPELAAFPVVVAEDVAWGDMDSFAHVSNILFFRYFQNARIEYMTRVGWFAAMDATGLGPIVKSTAGTFRRPLKYPDRLLIGARVIDVAADRVTFAHRIVSTALGAVAADGEAVIVCFDYRNGAKADLPADVRARIAELESPRANRPAWTPRAKLLPWSELLAMREQARAAGRVVVWTNGTFDLLHSGHVASLQQARALGDVLVVGVNSDRSVKAYKGLSRPILTQGERTAMLAALECVDCVVVFDEDTPAESLAKLKPDIHCKGDEYAPPHGKPVPERAVVEGYGGRIAYLPLVPGQSTSELLRRIAAAG